jgi:glycosyltransferase involved in cell wall biosynthesis
MRLLLDATSTDPGASGARTRLIHLLGEYFRLPRRHDVIVLTPRGRGITAQFVAHGIECREVEPAPPPFVRWRRSALEWDATLRQFGAAALQAETLPVPRTTFPLLLTLHDLRDLESPPLDARAAYVRWLLPRDFRRVARVIAVSRDTADLVVNRCRMPRDRVRVVANAPDPNVRRDEDPALRAALLATFSVPRRFVLALGHVEPRKNLGVLIAAVRRLRGDARFADLGVVCCGRAIEPERSQVAALATRDPAVPLTFTGPLDEKSRNGLLALASCIATPSRIEGFGLVPLEAMAAGVPVVAARARALPEVLGDAALFHEPNDAAELARQLAAVLDDPNLRRRLIAAGLERARSYSWRASAAALLAVHDEIAVEISGERLGSESPRPPSP